MATCCFWLGTTGATSNDDPVFLCIEQNSDDEIVSLLNGRPNAAKAGRSDDGATPMHIASMLGREVVVEKLLTCNADVNARDVNDNTPLIAAALGGHTSTVSLLVRHVGVAIEHRNNSGTTALAAAAWRGRLDALCELHACGASLSPTNNDGLSPRALAEEWGHGEVVKWLDEQH